MGDVVPAARKTSDVPTVPRVRAWVVAFVVLAALAITWANPPIDPPRGDVRIVVFGDFNGPYGAVEYPSAVAVVMRLVRDVWRPDLFLSPGDVIAGQSRSLPDDAFAAMWRAFDAAVAAPLPPASSRSRGNAWQQSATGRRPRVRRGSRTSTARGSPSTTRSSSRSPTATSSSPCLRAVLGQPAAAAAGYRIVVGHLPLAPVAVGRDRPGEFLAAADTIHAVMEDGGVDLAVSGHQAAYYFGRWGELELLFAGGVGGRRLLGHDAPARSTVSLLDLWFASRELKVTTFDLADMRVVPMESLPPNIGTVVRQDLEPPRAWGANP